MSKHDRARSLLYRRQILQENIRWKALDEIYKIYMLLHRSDLNISEIFRQKFSHFSAKFCKIYRSAAPTLLFLWAGQGSFLAAFRQGSAIFLAFSGQQARCRCQVGGRHLPSVSYGQAYQQTYSDTGFSESSVFAYLDRRVSFHTLAGSLSSNSCSAALICVFCATRRIRFFVSDLFQK